MQKREFLDILRESLQEEIPAFEIESNIRYYSEYIEQHSASLQEEEKCIEEIGDPRLIAQTILTSYEMSHSENLGKKAQGERYENYSDSVQEEERNNQDIKSEVLKMIPLRYKIVGIISTIAIVILLFFLARIFLIVLVRVVFPATAILLLVGICVKIFQK